MKRQYQFSVDSFQILLDPLLHLFYLTRQFDSKYLHFPTIVVLSSYGNISEALQQTITKSSLKDSRELILTDSTHTNANVKSKETTTNISNFFKKNKDKVVVLPGFVSQNKGGETTI